MSPTTSSQSLSQTVLDINTLSIFLSDSQFPPSPPPLTQHTINTIVPGHSLNLTTLTPTTWIIAPSAILHQAHTVFSALQSHLPKTLTSPSPLTIIVLTGGIGHSTTHLHRAILSSAQYSTLPSLIGRADGDLTDLPEAQVYNLIFEHFYSGQRIRKEWNAGSGLKVLVEDQSTNCGANARLSREMLERNGMVLGSGGRLDDVVLVQDPTMCRRSRASLERVYEEEVRSGAVRVWCWPGFVPIVCEMGGGIGWDEERINSDSGGERIEASGLWDMKRFYGLILGEVPRLRDDEQGYGPTGKGFIAHVDIPEEVEEAWSRLENVLEVDR